MTNLTRRSFFRLVAGAAALVAMPATAFPVHTLYGDGVTDDAAALDALLKGETVAFGPGLNPDGAGWVRSRLTLPTGVFRACNTIVFETTELGGTLDFNGSRLIADHGEDMLRIRALGFWLVTNGIFVRSIEHTPSYSCLYYETDGEVVIHKARAQ